MFWSFWCSAQICGQCGQNASALSDWPLAVFFFSTPKNKLFQKTAVWCWMPTPHASYSNGNYCFPSHTDTEDNEVSSCADKPVCQHKLASVANIGLLTPRLHCHTPFTCCQIKAVQIMVLLSKIVKLCLLFIYFMSRSEWQRFQEQQIAKNK